MQKYEVRIRAEVVATYIVEALSAKDAEDKTYDAEPKSYDWQGAGTLLSVKELKA